MKTGKPILKPVLPQQANHTFTFCATNLTARDAAFLGGVVKLFCDPDLSGVAAGLRRGNFAIEYKPDTGELHAFDLRQAIKDACKHGNN